MVANKLGIDIDGIVRQPNATKDLNYSYSDVINPPAQTAIEYPDRASYIAANGFITPAEFYGNIVNIGTTTDQSDGYLVMSSYSDGHNYDDVGWFWSEDLKNWCRYVYIEGNDGDPCRNIIYLSIWNGKNGWIPIPNIHITSEDVWSISNDTYGIAKYHNKIANRLFSDCISIARGRPVYFKPNSTDRIEIDMNENTQRIVGIRLQKTAKYSINDTNDFQTIRWQTVPENENNGATWYDYAQTDVRQGITTGIPCVYRLPTDEILMCTTFKYNSDAGGVYEYVFTNHAFEKQCMPGEYPNKVVLANKLLGTDWYSASKWLNSVCERFFGKGNDKTIADDWLNDDDMSTDMNDYEKNDYLNMLDSSKVFEQTNINKVNNLKCGFTINRPIITTRTVKSDDYAKKW